MSAVPPLPLPPYSETHRTGRMEAILRRNRLLHSAPMRSPCSAGIAGGVTPLPFLPQTFLSPTTPPSMQASLVGNSIYTFLGLSSGFLVQLRSIPVWLHWIQARSYYSRSNYTAGSLPALLRRVAAPHLEAL